DSTNRACSSPGRAAVSANKTRVPPRGSRHTAIPFLDLARWEPQKTRLPRGGAERGVVTPPNKAAWRPPSLLSTYDPGAGQERRRGVKGGLLPSHRNDHQHPNRVGATAGRKGADRNPRGGVGCYR